MVTRLARSGIVAEPHGGRDAAAASGLLRHELRTPITSILGYGELLAEEAGPGHDSQIGILGDINDAARRLLDQIDAMVDFMRATGRDLANAARSASDPQAILAEPIAAIRLGLKANAAAGPRAIGRILVVDDNASTLDLLSRRLRRDGHEVTSCDNGEGALELLAGSAYDLVLLDLLMPGLSGVDVLSRIKSSADDRLHPRHHRVGARRDRQRRALHRGGCRRLPHQTHQPRAAARPHDGLARSQVPAGPGPGHDPEAENRAAALRKPAAQRLAAQCPGTVPQGRVGDRRPFRLGHDPVQRHRGFHAREPPACPRTSCCSS